MSRACVFGKSDAAADASRDSTALSSTEYRGVQRSRRPHLVALRSSLHRLKAASWCCTTSTIPVGLRTSTASQRRSCAPDILFRAVEIPPGTHRVSFRFAPFSLGQSSRRVECRAPANIAWALMAAQPTRWAKLPYALVDTSSDSAGAYADEPDTSHRFAALRDEHPLIRAAPMIMATEPMAASGTLPLVTRNNCRQSDRRCRAPRSRTGQEPGAPSSSPAIAGNSMP